MEYLEDKSAIVTGGNRGIGLAICKELLRNHIKNLAIVDIELTAETFHNLKINHPKANIIFEKVDVSDKIQMENIYKKIKGEFQQIHVVVNSAGIFNDMDINKTLAVNLGGTLHSCMTAFELMDKTKGGDSGCIVNIASTLGLGPWHCSPIYNATKYGIIGFTRSMGHKSIEIKTGVKFMAVCPGLTETALSDASNHETRSIPNISECLGKHFETHPSQKPENVGRGVMKAIESGKNGSIWISEDSKNYEITLDEQYGIETRYGALYDCLNN